jgi:hypothetical protein
MLARFARNFWLAALLALALPFAQLQVSSHALQHLEQGSASTSQTTREKHGQQAVDICLKCVSLAHLASSIPSAHFTVPVPQRELAPTHAFGIRVHRRMARGAYARGPPVTLQ